MFSFEGYQAALSSGAIVQRSDRGVLAVSGADRVSWMQGLLTNDVDHLAEGASRYSAYLTPQGRMITDMHVVSRAGRLLLDVPASLAAPLRDRLDGLIFSEDVHVTDESAALRVWTVVRPDAMVDVVGEMLSAELQSLPAIDLDTFHVIRIERGLPLFLVDMNEDTIPLEAGIEDRAISFTKGCYVGQEIIVRVTHRGGGRVAKKLVKWAADGPARDIPVAGAKILSGAREIGHVTSAAFSPRLGRVVGLGYVQRDFVEVATALEIVSSDARLKAVVS